MRKWRILTVGVGGQGILLFSRVLGEACLMAGLPVVMSEVHGMAQRGGVVETNIVIGYRSPLVSEGEADILVGLEPVETLRALGRCRREGVVLSSTDPVVPQIVKDGLATYPDLDEPLNRLRETFSRVYLFPGETLAKEAGTSRALNMVALGALAGLELLEIPREIWLEALKKSVKAKYLEANLKAFESGYRITNQDVS
jgi:indolepyruvate ferredoxin oxidoreductase beta subunit